MQDDTELEQRLLADLGQPSVCIRRNTQLHRPSHSHLTLDLLRGLLVVLVSWDQVSSQFTAAKDAISKTESEGWEGPYSTYDGSWKKLLVRSVSHICAPGFFFVMGISMVLFTVSRREVLGWSWFRVTVHHFLRGFLFLLVDYLFDFAGVLPQLVDLLHGRTVRDSHGNDFSKGDGGKVIYHALFSTYRVMSALGLSMILGSLLLPFIFAAEKVRSGVAEAFGWLGFIVSFAVSTVAIVLAQEDAENLAKPPREFPHRYFVVHDPDQLLARALLFPGHLFANWTMLNYPILPWIGIAILGMGYGFVLRDTSRAHGKKLRWISLVLLISFVCIRGFGGKLNYRGKQRGENIGDDGWIAFFTQTKYPPDLAFACVTLSVLFMMVSFSGSTSLLYLEDVIEGGNDLDTREEAANEDKRDAKFLLCAMKKPKCLKLLLYPIVLFGRTPLFFYVTHKWIIQCVEAIFRLPEEPVGRFEIEIVVLVWTLLLMIMFAVCILFNRYRTSPQRSEVWRHM